MSLDSNRPGPSAAPEGDCRETQSLFSSCLDQDLSPGDQAGFDEHLGDCSDCRRAFSEFGIAISALRVQPRHPVPVSLAQAVLDEFDGVVPMEDAPEQTPRGGPTGWTRWAAAALILIGIGVFFGYLELRFQGFANQFELADGSAANDNVQRVQRELVQLRIELEQRSEAGNRDRRSFLEESLRFEQRTLALQAEIDRLTTEAEDFRRLAARESRLVRLEERWARAEAEMASWRGDLRARLQSLVTLLTRPPLESGREAIVSNERPSARDRAPREARPVEVQIAENGAVSLRFDRSDPAAIDQLFLLHESADAVLRDAVTQQLDAYFRPRVPEASEPQGSTLGIRGMFASRVRDEELATEEATRLQRYWDYWQRERLNQGSSQ